MKAMLLAAGLGTRLKPFTNHHPKALFQVNGKSILEHNIKYLQKYHIYDVVVNVHHFADQIENIIKINHGWGSSIEISDERQELLETGGGLLKACSYFNKRDLIVVMNSDIITNFPLQILIDFQAQFQPLASLCISSRDSKRQLLFNSKHELCGWFNRTNHEFKAVHIDDKVPHSNWQNFSFNGIQIVQTQIFDNITLRGKFSLIEAYLLLAKTESILGYDASMWQFVDMGKIENLKAAEQLVEV